jgi:hypothetical protein
MSFNQYWILKILCYFKSRISKLFNFNFYAIIFYYFASLGILFFFEEILLVSGEFTFIF